MNKELEKNILEIRLLENQIGQLEQQRALLGREIMELQALQTNLDEIKKVKQKEILVPFGKDIFIHSKLESAEQVLVNVGAKVIVKKDIPGAKANIEKQRAKFIEAKAEIDIEIDKVLQRITEIEKEVRSIKH